MSSSSSDVKYAVYEMGTDRRVLQQAYDLEEQAEQAAKYLSVQDPYKMFYVAPVTD